MIGPLLLPVAASPLLTPCGPPPLAVQKPAIVRPATADLPGLVSGMAFMPGFRHVAPAASHRVIDILAALGLTTGLQLCLDPSDAASYPGSGQTWADRSGNGYDFLLGASSSGESSDPTFTGSADDPGAYWGFDGGDYFTLDQSNPAWVENLHKDSAVFSLALWFHAPSNNYAWCGTTTNVAATVGIRYVLGTTTQNSLLVHRGLSTIMNFSSSATFSTGAWQFAAVSVDETTGAGVHVIDTADESFDCTYASPSASSANGAMLIAARRGPGAFSPNTSRMGMFLGWSTALSAAQLLAIRDATKARYGL